MSAMWNELRAVDNRRNEILSLIGIGGMPTDMFERYCGSWEEARLLINLGLVEIKKKRVFITKNGRNRLATR